MTEILECKNLVKRFGELYAVNDVSIAFKYNEVCSIVGPNGAGKTTLINLITNRIRPDGGRIFFMGKDITDEPEVKRVKLGIARSFQIPQLFENLSALENVLAGIFARENKVAVFFKDFKGFKDLLSEAIELLKWFDVPEHHLAKELPQGQRKLLDVAIAFALKPKVVLLDEPTSGVSSYEKRRIIEKIFDLREEKKMTLVMVEHDYEIAAMAPRTIVMNSGKVVAEGNLDELLREPEIRKLLMGE
jgi:branched-chain amino acid transport system ATP-binding protein